MSARLRFLAGFATAAVLCRGAESYRVVSDVPYAGGQKMDLYLPVGGEHRPAVVYFHGGGWVKGDKATGREKEIGRTLATAGYVFASANYRLGSKTWPGNLEDCRAALRFVRAHASEYGVDPGRMAVMGASAGAHLALLCGFRAQEWGTPVRAIVELYGITDLLTRRNVRPDGTALPTLDDAHSVEMLGVTRSAGEALWREASPALQVTKSVPPVLIVHGLSDPIVDYGQAVELANALRAQGVEHQMVLLEGVGHQFDLETGGGKPLPVDLRPIVLDFLARYLK